MEPKDTGRPAYDPADLLKLYIYGYVNRVRSSRRLESEATRNLEVIWLLCGLRPDFKTIADFRKDNHNAFKAVFRQFVLLCRKLDLFGCELVAVDGTRLKAVNSTDRNFTREKLKKLLQWADERLADYLARLDHADGTGDAANSAPAKNLAEKIAVLKQRRGRYAELSQEPERTGESQISLTDPDSRAMASYPKVGVGYNNAQVAVDAKHKLIVAQEVTNAGSDLGLLAQTAASAATGRPISCGACSTRRDTVAEIFDMIGMLGAMVGAADRADRLADELDAGLAGAPTDVSAYRHCSAGMQHGRRNAVDKRRQSRGD